MVMSVVIDIVVQVLLIVMRLCLLLVLPLPVRALLLLSLRLVLVLRVLLPLQFFMYIVNIIVNARYVVTVMGYCYRQACCLVWPDIDVVMVVVLVSVAALVVGVDVVLAIEIGTDSAIVDVNAIDVDNWW